MLQVLRQPESEYAISSSSFSIYILNADKLYDKPEYEYESEYAVRSSKIRIKSLLGRVLFCFLIGRLFLFVYFRSKVASL